MEQPAATDVHDLGPEPSVPRASRLPRSYWGGAVVAALAVGVIGVALGGALPGLSDNPADRGGDVRTVPGGSGGRDAGSGGRRPADAPAKPDGAGRDSAGTHGVRPGDPREPGVANATPDAVVAGRTPPTTVVLPDGTILTLPPVSVPRLPGVPAVSVPVVPTTLPKATIPPTPTLPKVTVPTTLPTVTVPTTLPAGPVPTTLPPVPTTPPTTAAGSLPSVTVPALPPATVPTIGL